MDKINELDTLERKLLCCKKDEVVPIMKRIRVLEKELYPENEIRFMSFLQHFDEMLENKTLDNDTKFER